MLLRGALGFWRFGVYRAFEAQIYQFRPQVGVSGLNLFKRFQAKGCWSFGTTTAAAAMMRCWSRPVHPEALTPRKPCQGFRV